MFCQYLHLCVFCCFFLPFFKSSSIANNRKRIDRCERTTILFFTIVCVCVVFYCFVVVVVCVKFVCVLATLPHKQTTHTQQHKQQTHTTQHTDLSCCRQKHFACARCASCFRRSKQTRKHVCGACAHLALKNGKSKASSSAQKKKEKKKTQKTTHNKHTQQQKKTPPSATAKVVKEKKK